MTQRTIGWLLVAVGVIFAVVLLLIWLDGYVSDAVTEDRSVSSEVVRNAQVGAERSAQADAERDKLVAARAQAEQLEAINETMHEPGGDPAAAVYDRLRKSSTAPR